MNATIWYCLLCISCLWFTCMASSSASDFWWNWSFQSNGNALQCQVEVFLIHVHPIGDRQISTSSRNILIHVIPKIVKIHFVFLIAVNRRRTINIWSCFGTKNLMYASILYTISGTMLRTHQFQGLWPLDIESMLKKNLWYIGSIIKFKGLLPIEIEVFFRYWVHYRSVILGYKDIEAKSFDDVHDISAMYGI